MVSDNLGMLSSFINDKINLYLFKSQDQTLFYDCFEKFSNI